MADRKYLIHLDLLGFQNLASKITKTKGISERAVREHLHTTINRRIDILYEKSIIAKKHSGSDDWLLWANDLNMVFKTLYVLDNHSTDLDSLEKIPLEIAIGSAEYDRFEELDAQRLFYENSTIEVLKLNIPYAFRSHVKKETGKSIKKTFIVLTEQVYLDFEPFDKKVCYKISTEKFTFYAGDYDKLLVRGKMIDFLECIEEPNSRYYDRINEVYVPPIEFDTIKQSLRDQRIVFITGTPEYGKTFTAVRLLWDFFNEGFEPRWLKGGDELERSKVSRRLKYIENELKPHHIVYFEDPFGKSRYEKREDLEREIGIILSCIEELKDTLVVITSREEIFKQFEKEAILARSLKDFEKKLNIKKPSYDSDSRIAILINWAKSRGCKWLSHQKLVSMLKKAVQHKTVLPTPLSIKDFVLSTVNIQNKTGLETELTKKSQSTANSFAQEFLSMRNDKKLFLSFPLVGHLPLYFVMEHYRNLVLRFKWTEALEFQECLDWFVNDKLKVIDSTRGMVLSFSHPSYEESLDFLIHDKAYQKNIFVPLLNWLFQLEINLTVGHISWIVARYYKDLPQTTRNLLFEAAKKKEAGRKVAWALFRNLERIPERELERLLLILAGIKKASDHVVNIMIRIFDKLPKESVSLILLKLLESGSSERFAAKVMVKKYSSLTPEIKNILFKLAKNKRTANAVAAQLPMNFDSLPCKTREELLRIFIEHKHGLASVAVAVVLNFDKLPRELGEKFLTRLANFSKCRKQLLNALLYSTEVPEALALRTILKLGPTIAFSCRILKIIEKNFHKVPIKRTEEIMLKFSEDDTKVSGRIVRIVMQNFDKFSEESRGLLLKKVCDKKSAKRYFLWARKTDNLPAQLIKYLPVEVREI